MEAQPSAAALSGHGPSATPCNGVGSRATGNPTTPSPSCSALLVLCALVLCALTVWQGIRVEADRTLPGALARHVNGLAVAISCLSHGHCHGYHEPAVGRPSAV
jgi:hypothetical protein